MLESDLPNQSESGRLQRRETQGQGQRQRQRGQGQAGSGEGQLPRSAVLRKRYFAKMWRKTWGSGRRGRGVGDLEVVSLKSEFDS